MAEIQYLTLLRGINVGGNNIIKMADLKMCFENMGLSDVLTYIQSGNVLFKSAEKDKAKLTKKIEINLSERFNYQARLVIITQKQLKQTVENAPREFGKKPDTFRYDVIFLKEPLTPKEAMKSVSIKEGVDNAYTGKDVLYFSRLIDKASSSHLTRIIGLPVYQNMTIRNWNTTNKLLALMKKNKPMTAKQFVERLKAISSKQAEKSNAHLAADKKDEIMGVKMGQIFALAKEYMGMELDEVEKLLDHPAHEARVGAVSIMDFQARNKKTSDERRKELFDLYIRRHDRINTWDLVDRSAIWVVGSYLIDKPRKILYKLAKSKMMAERRTAIVTTLFFIGRNDLDDGFKLAEIMLYDKEDLIHKANGWALRFTGDKDKKRLLKFLDKYAATMPRVTLRYAIEKMDKKTKEYYMNLGKAKSK